MDRLAQACEEVARHAGRLRKVAALADCRIFEVGISYYGRTYAEGKKIGWKDGVRAIWAIFKYNILR